MGFELQVRVGHGEANAALDWETKTGSGKDRNPGTADVVIDPLKRKTVRLLQQWLSRWQVVSEIGRDYEKFPVTNTFRVLGEHLYQIIFTGELDKSFEDSYKDAKDAGEQLRVMLSFDQDSAELAALPWEFLCRPDDSSIPFYLATHTDLILNRFMPGGREAMPLAEPPLRVLVIMCVSERGGEDQEEHMAQRRQILASIEKLRGDSHDRLDIRIAEKWDAPNVEAELKFDPHVVHIIGHARYVPDDLGGMHGEIELPGTAGAPVWNSINEVVDLLVRGKSPDQLARLVILHLCEMRPVDFTASFERLAPEFIAAGILSVLAMQYPLPASVAGKFISSFYGQLAAGDEIDTVVQKLRWQMVRDQRDQRLIGTPVLYMQSLGGQLVARQPEVPGEATSDTRQVSTKTPAGDLPVGRRLRVALWSVPADDELTEGLHRWIEQSTWSGDAAVNRQRVQQHWRLDPFGGERSSLYKAMLAVLGEGTDGAAS